MNYRNIIIGLISIVCMPYYASSYYLTGTGHTHVPWESLNSMSKLREQKKLGYGGSIGFPAVIKSQNLSINLEGLYSTIAVKNPHKPVEAEPKPVEAEPKPFVDHIQSRSGSWSDKSPVWSFSPLETEPTKFPPIPDFMSSHLLGLVIKINGPIFYNNLSVFGSIMPGTGVTMKKLDFQFKDWTWASLLEIGVKKPAFLHKNIDGMVSGKGIYSNKKFSIGIHGAMSWNFQ